MCKTTTLTFCGFSLLELLITVTLLSILFTLAYPVYTHHLVHVRRAQAQVALLDISTRMEEYYAANNYSYSKVSLTALGINDAYVSGDFYLLAIDSAEDNAYKISAVPQAAQARDDVACGSLFLNEKGEKDVSGKGSPEECWR
jgi:type IV pilus assembly protein PilE